MAAKDVAQRSLTLRLGGQALASTDAAHVATAGTPEPVAAAGALGTSFNGAREDHKHAGVTSVNGMMGTVIVGQGAPIIWGTQSVNAAANTRVLPPGYETATAGPDPLGFAATRAGTLKNLFARHNSAAGNGEAVIYRVRKNGVLTALLVSLVTGAIGQASNLVDAVVVAQGDFIELVAIKAIAIGSGVVDAIVTADFV